MVLGPGASCSGPVELPQGSVLAANAVATRTLTEAGKGWIGAPAVLYDGPREALIPRIGEGAA